MKAWVRLLAAGAAVTMLALPAGASAAAPRAHRRHIQVFPARSEAFMYLGGRGGYELAIVFKEPDLAILQVSKFDRETETASFANYGAHFQGSLPYGRLRADFGPVGRVDVRFRPGGEARNGRAHPDCTGRPGRNESGSFDGRIDLHGEGDYFHVAPKRADGSLDRTFRLRCHVKRRLTTYPPPSLREAVLPSSVFSFSEGILASLQVAKSGGGRLVGMRVDRYGSRSGADLQLGELEYQGEMPVGRGVEVLSSPPGTFLTSLPGEHPTTSTLKPPAPFSGEAEYVATSPVSHSWTGDLAVHLPGQLLPLTGPEYASSLCVARALGNRSGCSFVLPDWQWNEEE